MAIIKGYYVPKDWPHYIMNGDAQLGQPGFTVPSEIIDQSYQINFSHNGEAYAGILLKCYWAYRADFDEAFNLIEKWASVCRLAYKKTDGTWVDVYGSDEPNWEWPEFYRPAYPPLMYISNQLLCLDFGDEQSQEIDDNSFILKFCKSAEEIDMRIPATYLLRAGDVSRKYRCGNIVMSNLAQHLDEIYEKGKADALANQ